MRINYNILWFEDNRTSYNTKKTSVEEIIKEFGFNFTEPQNEVDGSNIDAIEYNKFDLIIADMNLSDGITSMELMNRIRGKEIFTEVLFYSSNGEDAVRNELAKYRIDGAYCSDRNNEDFEYKAKEVIQTLIKKTQDLTNMRGLVMAETSELDRLMIDILKIFFVDQKTNESESIFTKLLRDIDKSHKRKLDQSENCDKKCTHKVLAEETIKVIMCHEFDSSKKSQAVYKIIQKSNFDYDGNFHEDYNSEISKLRNQLAHCHSEIQGSKEILIIKNGEEEVIFDESKFKHIRIIGETK